MQCLSLDKEKKSTKDIMGIIGGIQIWTDVK